MYSLTVSAGQVDHRSVACSEHSSPSLHRRLWDKTIEVIDMASLPPTKPTIAGATFYESVGKNETDATVGEGQNGQTGENPERAIDRQAERVEGGERNWCHTDE